MPVSLSFAFAAAVLVTNGPVTPGGGKTNAPGGGEKPAAVAAVVMDTAKASKGKSEPVSNPATKKKPSKAQARPLAPEVPSEERSPALPQAQEWDTDFYVMNHAPFTGYQIRSIASR